MSSLISDIEAAYLDDALPKRARDLLREAASALRAQQSQPIETSLIAEEVSANGWKLITGVRDDHCRVLVFVPRYGAMTAHCDSGRWHLHACLDKSAVPTHWLPLPTPPQET